jgi:hypothetical protein
MLWRPARKVPWACVVVIVAAGVVKAGLWGTTPFIGWQGRYQTEEANPERAESFWHWRVQDHKLDRAIEFTGPKTGLMFLNAFRYCCTPYEPSREIALPIHASWRGYVFARRDQRIAFDVEVNGPLNVIVRDAASGSVEPAQMPMSFRATASGWHILDIAYIKPAAKLFEVIVHATVDGVPALIALQPAAPTDGQRAAARVLDVVLLASFAIGLAWAWLPAWRAQSMLRAGYLLPAIAVMCCSAVFLARGARISILERDYSWTIPDGSDQLAYESFSRDILLHGPLMTVGSPIGAGTPYFFYPLYPYVLAAAHAFFGEDYGAEPLLNGVAIAVAFPLLWWLGLREAGRWWGVVLAAALGRLAFIHFRPFMSEAYTDSLFLPLVILAILAAGWWLDRGTKGLALLAGLVSALATATRPSFMLFLPVLVVVLLAYARRGQVKPRWYQIGYVVAGFMIGVLPFTIRNYIVSGRPVMLVSSWLQIPYFMVPPTVPNPFATLPSDPPTLAKSLLLAADYTRSHPAQVVLLELRKVAFTLGFTGWTAYGTVFRPEFVMITTLFLVTAWRGRIRWPLSAAVWAFWLSHLAAMVVAAPFTFPYKALIPFHVVMLAMTARLWQPAIAPRPPASLAAASRS